MTFKLIEFKTYPDKDYPRVASFSTYTALVEEQVPRLFGLLRPRVKRHLAISTGLCWKNADTGHFYSGDLEKFLDISKTGILKCVD